MSGVRRAGEDDVIFVEHEDPRYDGVAGAECSLARHRRAPGQLGSGV
jgi:hypothetical protein